MKAEEPGMRHIKYIEEAWAPDANQQGWNGPGWYFFDETEAFCHGPYGSPAEAQREMIEYARQELGL